METPSISLRNGFRCMPEDGVTVEDVLVAVGEKVGHDNISSASRMNRAVVVFLKQQQLVNQVIESGLIIKDELVQVTPLHNASSRVVISNVPPFISDDVLERELVRFGKIASPFRAISLGCKNPSLKHVMSFRRQVYMFLESPDRTLNVSFRIKYEGGSYMIYATTGSLRCFECGDVGHKRQMCPHKDRGQENIGPVIETDAQASSIQTGQEEISGLTEVRQSEVNMALNVAANTSEIPVVVATSSYTDDDVVKSKEHLVVEQDNKCDENVLPSTSFVQHVCDAEKSRTDSMTAAEDDLSEESSVLDMDSCSQYGFEESSQDTQKELSLYTLEEIDQFLDNTFGKQVDVKDFFPDVEKFVKSVIFLQKTVGVDLLSEKKRFRLKKHLTTVRKARKIEKKGTSRVLL